MKNFYFICAGLCLIGLLNVGIGYYTILRIMITIGAILILINEPKKEFSFWVISSVLIAIVFNPIIPVYLQDKSIWMILDIIVATWFIIKANSPIKI